MTRSSDIDSVIKTDITGLTTSGDITINGSTVSSVDWSKIVVSKIHDDFFIPSSISSWPGEEFVDYLPSMDVINEMIEEYPTLKQTYENFKSTYELVKHDWESKKNNE